MNLLLDTHTLIWWLADSPLLSAPAREAIADRANTVWVSAASAWEITTKFRIGKLPGVQPVINTLEAEILREGFQLLDIRFAHGCLAGSLKHDHRDPFDRMLIAQALQENLILVSNESLFDAFGVTRIW